MILGREGGKGERFMYMYCTYIYTLELKYMYMYMQLGNRGFQTRLVLHLLWSQYVLYMYMHVGDESKQDCNLLGKVKLNVSGPQTLPNPGYFTSYGTTNDRASAERHLAPISNSINSTVVHYADDMVIYKTI